MNNPIAYAVLRLQDAVEALRKASDALRDDLPHETQEWISEAVQHMWKAHCAIEQETKGEPSE